MHSPFLTVMFYFCQWVTVHLTTHLHRCLHLHLLCGSASQMCPGRPARAANPHLDSTPSTSAQVICFLCGKSYTWDSSWHVLGFAAHFILPLRSFGVRCLTLDRVLWFISLQMFNKNWTLVRCCSGNNWKSHGSHFKDILSFIYLNVSTVNIFNTF